MSSLFFYGTLCHLPLLEAVLGRPSQPVPAALPGHAVYWAKDQSFPLIVAEAGGIASGLMLEAPSAEDLARLDFYEGAFGYQRKTVRLADGSEALTYFPEEGQWQPGAIWRLADWVAERGAVVTSTAGDFMALRGSFEGTAIARRYPQMLSRAASRLRAEGAAAPADLRHDARPEDLQILTRKTPYAHYFAVEELDYSHRRFDGSLSAPVNRTVFLTADAATVLPYDPVTDQVLLVEQIRPAVIGRGAPNPWLLEPIAGRLDPFETPETCVRREALEEAGLQIDRLIKVAEYYPSPAAKTEYLYSYIALCDLSQRPASQIGGLDSEGEDIRSHVISFDRLMELITTPEAADGPLILTALWLSTQRETLRHKL